MAFSARSLDSLISSGCSTEVVYREVVNCLNLWKRKDYGNWEKYRDDMLTRYAALWQATPPQWTYIVKWFKNECGKEITTQCCRARYVEFLDPRISKVEVTEEEYDCIIALHGQYGKCHTEIRNRAHQEGHPYRSVGFIRDLVNSVREQASSSLSGYKMGKRVRGQYGFQSDHRCFASLLPDGFFGADGPPLDLGSFDFSVDSDTVDSNPFEAELVRIADTL